MVPFSIALNQRRLRFSGLARPDHDMCNATNATRHLPDSMQASYLAGARPPCPCTLIVHAALTGPLALKQPPRSGHTVGLRR